MISEEVGRRSASLSANLTECGTLQGNDVYVGCKLAMAELIMSGCTTTSDHHYVFPNDVQV